VDVDGAGRAGEFNAPDAFGNRRAREDAAFAFEEETEELEFFRRESENFFIGHGFVAGVVHDDAIIFDALRFGLTRDAAKNGFDAREKFAPAEWFADVIVGAHFEAHHHVRLIGLHADHDDGHAFGFGIGLQQAADFETVHLRQADVEQKQIGRIGLDFFEAFFRVVGKADGVAVGGQQVSRDLTMSGSSSIMKMRLFTMAPRLR